MSLTNEQKQKIRDIIYDAGKQYIPVQELKTAAEMICDSPTEESVQKAQDYLSQFPYLRLGQTQICSSRMTDSLISNDIRIGFSKVRELLNLYPWD